MKKVILLLTAGLLLTSCASKKKFNELQGNYNTLQSEYQAAQVKLAENRVTIKTLEERLADAKAENERLAKAYAALQGSFDKNLQAGNVNIAKLVDCYHQSGALAMVTAVHPTARCGELQIDNDDFVRSFKEKPQVNQGWINGGLFVLHPRVFDYIENDLTTFEREPLERLAAEGQLKSYRHEGFWQCMDTVRDRDLLNQMWDEGRAPWAVDPK